MNALATVPPAIDPAPGIPRVIPFRQTPLPAPRFPRGIPAA